MRTFIKISETLREELIERFATNRTSVYRALNYLSNSEQSEAIRQYALNHGACVTTERSFTSSVHVTHDEINQRMIYCIDGGIRLTISKRDSSATIWKGETQLEHYDEALDNNGWGNLLYRACELAQAANA